MPSRFRPPSVASVAPKLPDALLDPWAYPSLPEQVELRETHISWVFLAGGRAYKVKKPVRFPFVDYGTLARRRAACAAEVRLNRRFAAGIYAGVVALVPRGRDGLAVAHECDPRRALATSTSSIGPTPSRRSPSTLRAQAHRSGRSPPTACRTMSGSRTLASVGNGGP
jgi:hypothetical protein